MKRQLFVLSDHTGLTAGAIAHALLSQFPRQQIEFIERPFLDTLDKVATVAKEIGAAQGAPLVFSSLVEPRARELLREKCGCRLYDIFEAFTAPLEEALEEKARPAPGKLHGIRNHNLYQERIRALDFSMIHDDGAVTRNYGDADVILLGVSRSGKTPTCLYLALHQGLQAANYPLVEEDLESTGLPEVLTPYRNKLVGLTIDPLQLQRIRAQRRSGGRYSSVEQCQWEVRQAEALFRRNRIPFLDTTAISIEEIAAHITAELISPHGQMKKQPPEHY